MTAELDSELAQLRAHRDRLATLVDEAEADMARVERLRVMAEAVPERLATMDPRERRQVLGLFEVRVKVADWEPCEACNGKGKVKGGTGGIVCEACRATRFVPRLTITGTVMESLYGQVSEGGNVGGQEDTALKRSPRFALTLPRADRRTARRAASRRPSPRPCPLERSETPQPVSREAPLEVREWPGGSDSQFHVLPERGVPLGPEHPDQAAN